MFQQPGLNKDSMEKDTETMQAESTIYNETIAIEKDLLGTLLEKSGGALKGRLPGTQKKIRCHHAVLKVGQYHVVIDGGRGNTIRIKVIHVTDTVRNWKNPGGKRHRVIADSWEVARDIVNINDLIKAGVREIKKKRKKAERNNHDSSAAALGNI